MKGKITIPMLTFSQLVMEAISPEKLRDKSQPCPRRKISKKGLLDCEQSDFFPQITKKENARSLKDYRQSQSVWIWLFLRTLWIICQQHACRRRQHSRDSIWFHVSSFFLIASPRAFWHKSDRSHTFTVNSRLLSKFFDDRSTTKKIGRGDLKLTLQN